MAGNANAPQSSAVLNQDEIRRVMCLITSLLGAEVGRHCKGCALRWPLMRRSADRIAAHSGQDRSGALLLQRI
jgi:hypothetical protein